MSEEIYKTVEQLIKETKRKETVIEINNLQTNKDGFSNDITMFHLTYSQGGDIFSNEVVLKKFSENVKFNKELNILRSKAVNSTINIPTVYFEDKEKRIMLMELVKGATLDKYYLANPEDMQSAFRKFGVTLAQVHSICTDRVRNFFTDNDLRQEVYIDFYIESLKNRVAKFEDPVYINCLQNISDMFKTVSFTEVLNHGDYHFWNTIITDENSLYILDWEKAFIGDPRYDIANTLVLGYSWFGTSFKEPMLGAYQNITNKKIENLECFEALSSFDSFTKMVPLIKGADDSHIRDRSFEWLKRRYELFVRHNGKRINEAEEYLFSKGVSFII
ncbi:aminoglycoside phosphotransferase family protein [Lederbergia citrea]|uniref:aminoglycoside phosphotransferase family protein n=1 Tax=Lederbergia citrea TaxID=2833581 RepID=UPI001BC8DA7D|nr:aminoglycoside phosphotransferase family protein [Lederbergia citrea]MBS4206320.1 aminoglycoside phosphotransferase family protein [Lederbergia citrea]